MSIKVVKNIQGNFGEEFVTCSASFYFNATQDLLDSISNEIQMDSPTSNYVLVRGTEYFKFEMRISRKKLEIEVLKKYLNNISDRILEVLNGLAAFKKINITWNDYV